MTDIEENMNEPRMNFDTFIQRDKVRNAWIYERDIAIYVRRSVRFINNEATPCLDLASVEVVEKHRGIGIFTGFLKRFEDAAKQLNRAVFVESILNARLVSFLARRGYVKHPHSVDLCPSMYKVLS